MLGHEANSTVNQARTVLVTALGLQSASGWEVAVRPDSVTPDPGEPAAGQARELLRRGFQIPDGHDFIVLVRPGTATYIPDLHMGAGDRAHRSGGAPS